MLKSLLLLEKEENNGIINNYVYNDIFAYKGTNNEENYTFISLHPITFRLYGR